MKSKDEQIEKFLAELKVKDSDKYEVLTNLRSVVFTSISNLSETFKYGGILFSINDNFGGLYVSKQHVSFEFTYGYKLDTELALEGDGKYRRHLKFRTLDEVNQSKAKIKLLLHLKILPANLFSIFLTACQRVASKLVLILINTDLLRGFTCCS